MPDGIYLPRESRRETLWERIDRLRYSVPAYTALFVALSGLAVSVIAGTVLAFFWLRAYSEVVVSPVGAWSLAGRVLVRAYGVTFAIGAALALLWVGYSLLRGPRWMLERVAAVRVPKGEQLATKFALKDMAIASGMLVAPELWWVDCPNVNAFVYDRPRMRPLLGVTRGFVERLPVDQQRAVFASMVARVVGGQAARAAALASFMGPLGAWRETNLLTDWDERGIAGRPAATGLGETSDTATAGAAFGFVFVMLVIVGELMAAGQREGQLRSAERADAEGMLLLKDPRSMLDALEAMVRLDNYVPGATEGLADLFFSWSGEGATDDETDPEWRRVSRLREVLGVEGVRLYEALEFGRIEEDQAISMAPPAPRLERE